MAGQPTGGVRRVATRRSGIATAVVSPFARQTFVPLPTNAAGQAARVGANVPAVVAPNARQTHVVT
jgi:hypothetical protein